MTGTTFKYETTAGVRWGYVLDVPAPDGARKQRRRRGYARKRDAQDALTVELEQLRGGTVVDDRSTLETYVRERWLPSIEPRSGARRSRGRVAASTFEAYSKTLEAYLLPTLGSTRLVDLHPQQVDDLYDQLETTGGRSGTGLSPKTLQNIHGVLSRVLRDAVDKHKVLHRNPLTQVDPPKADKPQLTKWSVEQLRTFLEHAAEDELHAAWMLYATTGARRGEVAGLTWDDLDLDAGQMRVAWTLGHVGHDLRWKPPKTEASERTIALDPMTVVALREHRRRQLERRLFAGPVWQDTFTDSTGRSRSGLVWVYGDGSPLHPKTHYERFLKLSAAAGLPRIRLHDVRHTYATAVLERSESWHDVQVLSERLGHASTAMTIDVYGKPLAATRNARGRSFAAMILGETDAP